MTSETTEIPWCKKDFVTIFIVKSSLGLPLGGLGGRVEMENAKPTLYDSMKGGKNCHTNYHKPGGLK